MLNYLITEEEKFERYLCWWSRFTKPADSEFDQIEVSECGLRAHLVI